MDTKTSSKLQDPEEVRSAVRQHYGKTAAEFQPAQPAQASCCGSGQSACCGSTPASASSQASSRVQTLYETPDVLSLPEEVSGLSLGCGDPITLAALQPGQTVLDLGSGGGIDCFLAAKQVGESGRVIGVDMTAQMIEKARANQSRMGYPNVEFRLGEIEHLPVADGTVDVIISNCVINLSPDKPQVLREALRVLKPGGKLAVSDIVTDGPLPQEIKDSISAWAGCIAGALDAQDFSRLLEQAGFEDVKVEPVWFDEQSVQEIANDLRGEMTQTLGQTQSSCCGSSSHAVNDTDDEEPHGCGCGSSHAAGSVEGSLTLEQIASTIFSARISAVKPG